MSPLLIKAVIAITLALILYTIGVWSEHRAKVLKPVHLVFFWLGLCMDTAGTIRFQLSGHACLRLKLKIYFLRSAGLRITQSGEIFCNPKCKCQFNFVQKVENNFVQFSAFRRLVFKECALILQPV